MKSSLQKLSVIAFVAAFCLAGLPGGTALAADQKIGTVDLHKVFATYYKTVRSNEDMRAKGADMEKEQKELENAELKLEDEWQKLIDKAEDQALSADERAKSKKAAESKLVEIKASKQNLQQFNVAANSKMREWERERRDNIVKDIKEVLKVQAKAAGYTLVLDVSGETSDMEPVVLYSTGVNDMTEGLIKELNAADLATPTTTTAPDKSAKTTNSSDKK